MKEKFIGVRYIEHSQNQKIGDADATYASIEHTCPSQCTLKGHGCYAETSYTGILNRKLEKEATAENHDGYSLSVEEASAIDACYKGKQVPNRNLRLHVFGDCASNLRICEVAASVYKWKKRGGQSCWTYTHSWNNGTDKDRWGVISVIASVSNTKQAEYARLFGYATAIIVNKFPSTKAFTIGDYTNIKYIPCLSQTHGLTCIQCRLCLDADKLYRSNRGIAFLAHGSNRKKVKTCYV